MTNKIELYISRNEVITDLLATNNTLVLEEIIRASRALLRANGRVIFTETYSNAPQEIAQVFERYEDFELWVSEQNQLRASLNQDPLGVE